MVRGSCRGQAISEYAMLVAVASMAVAVMQVYHTRSVQSQVKFIADLIGTQEKGLRFEEGSADVSESASRTHVDRSITRTQAADGSQAMVINQDKTFSRGDLRAFKPNHDPGNKGVTSYREVKQEDK